MSHPSALHTWSAGSRRVGDCRVLNPGLVEKAISPLLDWAEEVVPRQRWGSTPIFLFGTAGLRKLPEEHQENVLGTVRHILAACPFRCGLATPGVHLGLPVFFPYRPADDLSVLALEEPRDVPPPVC